MKRLCLALLCCVACPVFLSAQTQEIQDKLQTILYVQRLQTKAGGFVASAPLAGGALPKPSLRATSAAVRTLKYLGSKVPDKDACVQFVASCFDKASGGFADTPDGKADVFSTAVGAMAVVALQMPVEKYSPGIIKFLADKVTTFDEVRIAVAGLEALQKPSPKQQAWGDIISDELRKANSLKGPGRARALGGLFVATLRMGNKIDAAAALTELREGQGKDGGYGKAGAAGSDLESTYRVLRGFHMLKGRPDVERLRAFMAKCRNADGGYGVAPGQPSTVSGTYYVAIIEHWLAEKK
jgi:hypothetical protein